jgi:excisionase family DNA binding protein
MDRVTVAEAAQRLGVSQDAVYKRIKRGTIPWDKAEEGKTVVYIEEANESTNGPDLSTDGSAEHLKRSTDIPGSSSVDVSIDVLVDELRDRVSFLEEELRRKDTILMSLVQRVPELQAPRDNSPETPGAAEMASEGADRVNNNVPQEPQEPSQRRSWLYKFLGGRDTRN